MKLNVAYLRVSTEAQTEKYGLDVQKQKILEYCEKNGVKIDRWYIDGGYSGSKLDRPEMQKLLSDAEKGEIGTVFVYKLDRLSRDTVDTLNLLNKTLPSYGVRIVSMTEEIRTENPMDKVMVTMNAAMNQYEREVIRMRMSAGMVERVKKGLWMGGGRTPIGYRYDRNDGLLHPDEEWADKVREAYRMYIDGYSCEKIANILGFSCEQSVARVLNHKSYIGLIEYRGEEYQGLHEPILDEDTYYTAQECMKKRRNNSHISNDHILTGLCWCGVCGARMRYHKWGGNPKIICYSQFAGKDYMRRDENCNNKKVVAGDIENEVESAFKRFIINVEKKEKRKSNYELIKSEMDRTNSKIKKLYGIYLENESENVMELIREEESRAKDLKKQLELERKKDRGTGLNKLDRIKRVSDIWDSLSIKEKNGVLKQCIEKVVITGSDIDIFFVSF